MTVPDAFVRAVVGVYGEAVGRSWVARLPAVLAGVADRWSLAVGEPYPLSYAYVTRVTRADGTPAVLKLTPPGAETLATEAEVLRLAAGDGAVRLLEADLEAGALLLERAEPGETLTVLQAEDDDAATRVAAEVGRRLHRPVPAASLARFPTVDDWARAAFSWLRSTHAGAGPLPADLVELGEAEHRRLAESAAPPVVLHGDLHHGNLLRSARGWLAIDPHGVLGEPAYEAAPLLRNPLGLGADPGTPALLARRLPILAAAYRVAEDRIRGWGVAHNTVSLIWSLQDGHGEVDTSTLAVVRILAEGLRRR